MNSTKRIFYLGPVGTFSGDAAFHLSHSSGSQISPCQDVRSVIENVLKDKNSVGVVPIENSVQGELTITFDSLIFFYNNAYIIGEVVIPIAFCSFRRSGEGLSGIHTIMSHPHALAQCGDYIRKSSLSLEPVSSTARACQIVSDSEDNGLLAIASKSAGQQYGLKMIDENIEDHSGAVTKFYVLGHYFPEPSIFDKTVIVAIPRNETQGVLVDLLGSLSNRKIDINSIHSRPLRSSLGKYCFIITFTGHLSNCVIVEALREIIAQKAIVKILGSFPAWEGSIPTVPFKKLPGGIDNVQDLDNFLDAASIYRN